MNFFDVTVIGAGPAGIFAALTCKKAGLSVALFDKNKTLGRKILISGGGKCNVTQDEDMSDFINRFGGHANFVKPALLNFTNEDFINYLNINGIPTTVMENHKVFPKSMKSTDVVNLLTQKVNQAGIQVFKSTTVEQVKKEEAHFHLTTTAGTYSSRFLIITTGGTSFPATGTTGDGHVFAKQLGHKIVPTNFALAPLFIKNFQLSDFSGLSFENLTYTHWRGGKKIGTYCGDMLITHKGVSGPGIINNTRYMVRDDVVKLNFVGTNDEENRGTLTKLLQKNPKLTVKNALTLPEIPKRLLEHFLMLVGIDSQIKCAELSKIMRTQLLTLLTAYEMDIKSVGCVNSAMVTAGGVSLKDVNPKTMASRRVDGLYFAGEVLDVDGDTGGYNIQFAVSSGILAGSDVGRRSRDD